MKLFVILALLIVAIKSYSQVGASFIEAKKRGISTEMLDKNYVGGIGYTPGSLVQAPFANQEEAYGKAYVNMLQDLGKFLSKNNFKWEKPTKGFNRIYFNPDGSIAYFLYNFKAGEITAEKEKQFDKLLNQFIKTYKFPMNCKVKFAQCSPVTYMN